MVRHSVGRLPVIERDREEVIGILTRSDLLRAHAGRLDELHEREEPPVGRWLRDMRQGRES
jgi:CBS domain-containing protein